MFNFADATEKALTAGAAVEAADANALVATIAALLADAPRRQAMHDAALAFHASHRGAADRLMTWLAPRLDAALAARNKDAPNAPDEARAGVSP
jgi:3-deoxy-D-manno-octulosonic-acid transferase